MLESEFEYPPNLVREHLKHAAHDSRRLLAVYDRCVLQLIHGVDRLERVVIIRADFDDKTSREFVALINPEIVKAEGEIISDYEGCLSVKDIYGKVPRHSKIRIKALDRDGHEVRFKAEGFLARVIQHEIDHTNGVLFIDHIRDQTQAFYRLNEKGELKPLDYDEHIKDNTGLWD